MAVLSTSNVTSSIIFNERMRNSELCLYSLCSSVSLTDARFMFDAQFRMCGSTEIIDDCMFNGDT